MVDHGDTDEYVRVPKFVRYQVKIVNISCGAEHSIMCTADGELYSMGSNSYGQLGLGQAVKEVHKDHFSSLSHFDQRHSFR